MSPSIWTGMYDYRHMVILEDYLKACALHYPRLLYVDILYFIHQEFVEQTSIRALDNNHLSHSMHTAS